MEKSFPGIEKTKRKLHRQDLPLVTFCPIYSLVSLNTSSSWEQNYTK